MSTSLHAGRIGARPALESVTTIVWMPTSVGIAYILGLDITIGAWRKSTCTEPGAPLAEGLRLLQTATTIAEQNHLKWYPHRIPYSAVARVSSTGGPMLRYRVI